MNFKWFKRKKHSLCVFEKNSMNPCVWFDNASRAMEAEYGYVSEQDFLCAFRTNIWS